MDIRDRIRNGEYENPLTYGSEYKSASSEERAYFRKLRMEKDIEIRNNFKYDLFDYIFGDKLSKIPYKAQEIFWQLAWSEGHSFGYEEVVTHAESYAELVLAMLDKQD